MKYTNPPQEITIPIWAVILGFFSLFFWGFFYFIHSSEFWSITIAQDFFNSDLRDTIMIKPLFHLLLYIPFLFSLSDVEHLYVVKALFAACGALQVILFYLIFTKVSRNRLWALLATCALLANPLYSENFFRVRTDQVSVTLFLLFIFLSMRGAFRSKKLIFWLTIFPLIGVKSILFSILIFINSLIVQNFLMDSFRANKKYFYIYVLASLSGLLLFININWHSVVYFIDTFQSFSVNSVIFKEWLRYDFIVICITLTSLFFTDFNSFIEDKTNITLSKISTSCLILILLVSQKFSFLIASFIPVFYLTSFLLLFFISTRYKIFPQLFVIFSLIQIGYGTYNLSRVDFYYSNSNQVKFIEFIAPLLQKEHLSYLDGAGTLPRQSNSSCFVSVDDSSSNQNCLNQIEKGTPDVIILTSRLMSILKSGAKISDLYRETTHNIFVRNNLSLTVAPPKNLQPALLTFGFER